MATTAEREKQWGLEVLYEYEGNVEAGDVVVDIVAVHGLGANPDFAWFRKLDDSARHSTEGVNWLKELLPNTLAAKSPRVLARVLCFKYDSGWFGKKLTRTRLSNLARKLLDSLEHEVVQPPDQPKRPLIFIGHSFGGIVIEQAIVQAGSIGSVHGKRILDVLTGIVFLGTPHGGSDMTKFGLIVAHAAAVLNLGEATLLEDVERDSWRMRDMINDFIQIVHKKDLKNDDEIVCFFENKPTDYSTRVPFIGRFSSTMLSGMVVDETSAVLGGCHGVQLDSDHFKLNKFRDKTDSNYRTVANNIKRIAAKGRSLLEKREKDTRASQIQHFLVPRKRVKDFVGRGPQLRSIAESFCEPRSSGPCILIVHALGGQGKSQLALEYYRMCRIQNVYRGVFWISAADKALATNSFRKIAVELGIVGAEQAIDDNVMLGLVKKSLEDWQERWLLIFDNYDSPTQFDDIQEFFSDGTTGDILITSRSRDLDRLGDVMELGPLTDEEGVQLLLRSYDNKDIEDHIEEAKKIVKRLGGLALAIDQASSYLAARRRPISQLGSFLQLYEEQRKKILDFVPGKFWEYQKDRSHEDRDKNKALSTFTTWEMSFNELFMGDRDSAERAAHLLTLSAFMAPTTIPEFMFRWYWESRHFWIIHYGANPRRAAWLQSKSFAEIDRPYQKLDAEFSLEQHNVDGWKDRLLESLVEESEWDAEDFALLVTACEDLSLLQDVYDDGDSGIKFSLHPLVRDWLQMRQESEKSSVFLSEVTSAVASCSRVTESESETLEQRTTRIIHAHECLLRDPRLRNAKMMTREGPEFFEAVYWLASQCVQESEHTLAVDLLQTALQTDVMSRKADIQAISNNQNQNTHPAWQELIVDLRRLLAEIYCELSNYSQAEAVIHEAIGRCTKASLEDYQWNSCRRVVGEILRLQGHHANALSLQQEQLAWHLTDKYAKHHQVVRAKIRIAGTFRKMSQSEKAIDIYREILEARQGLTIEEETWCKTELAFALEDVSEMTEAESFYREALSMSRSHRGPRHRETLKIMCGLASNLRDEDKLNQAEEVCQELLQESQQAFFTDLQLFATYTLGTIMLRQDKYVQAEHFLKEALEAKDLAFGEADLERSWAELSLIEAIREQGSTAYDAGSYLEAELKYQEAINLARECVEQGRAELGDSLYWLGRCHHRQTKFTQAEAALRESLEKHLTANASRANLSQSRIRLGEALASQACWIEAEVLFHEGLDALSDSIGYKQESSEDAANEYAGSEDVDNNVVDFGRELVASDKEDCQEHDS